MFDIVLTSIIILLLSGFPIVLALHLLHIEKCKKCKSENLKTVTRYEHRTIYGMYDEYDDYKIHSFGYICNECGFSKINKKKLKEFEKNNSGG